MPDFSDLTSKGQDLVARAVDLVPTPGEIVDQVTATANELLSLSQDVQEKVLAALKWNA